jgi:hypothetical protein
MFEPTMDDVLRLGEQIYLGTLKDKLEKSNLGDYVVIDTETAQFVIKNNKLNAIETAKKDFGEHKLFYTVQIGSLDKPTVNHRAKSEYAWNF